MGQRGWKSRWGLGVEVLGRRVGQHEPYIRTPPSQQRMTWGGCFSALEEVETVASRSQCARTRWSPHRDSALLSGKRRRHHGGVLACASIWQPTPTRRSPSLPQPCSLSYVQSKWCMFAVLQKTNLHHINLPDSILLYLSSVLSS